MTDSYDGILTRTCEDFPSIHAQRKRDWFNFYDDDFLINKFTDHTLCCKIEEGLDDWVRVSPEVLTQW